MTQATLGESFPDPDETGDATDDGEDAERLPRPEEIDPDRLDPDDADEEESTAATSGGATDGATGPYCKCCNAHSELSYKCDKCDKPF